MKNFERMSFHLENSYKKDSLIFCENYVYPIVKSLLVYSPQQVERIPFILENQFGELYNYYSKCSHCLSSLDSSHQALFKKKSIQLFLGYLGLKDQWYRVPTRTMNGTEQDKFDLYCRNELDKIFGALEKKNISLANRTTIFAILLHSTDCDWSKIWLKKYYYLFSDFKRINQNLDHFMWRSYCNRDSSIISYYNSVCK